MTAQMFAPDELVVDNFAGGGGVSTGIEIALTKTAQVRMCGNSVSPPPAAALVRAQFDAEQV